MTSAFTRPIWGEYDPTTDDSFRQRIIGSVQSAVYPRVPSNLALTLLPSTPIGVRVAVRHRASFDTEFGWNRGPLPSSMQNVSSESQLHAGIEQQYGEAVQEAGDLIDAWIAREGDDYRATLGAEDCLRERPTLGFQQTCGTCEGNGRLVCTGCGGSGRCTCHRCGGNGQMACPSCNGTAQVTCSRCGGRGTIEKTEYELTPMDAQNTMNQQRQLTRMVPCGCNGGKVPCSCGTGRVTCSGCGGSGIVACGNCGATGYVSCGDCAGTGAIHQYGRVVSAVAYGTHVSATCDDAEDQQTVESRVPFAELGDLATLSLTGHRRDGFDVTLAYGGQVVQQSAEVRFGNERLVIHSYGSSHCIYDFHDLAGRWLSPDVEQLESAVRGHSLLPFGESTGLADTLKRFLDAEVNTRIAADARSVEEFQGIGLVSPSYVQRASAALARAMPRLYASEIIRRAVWLPVVTAAAMLVTYVGVTAWANHAHFIPWSKFRFALIGFALMCAMWAVLELGVARQLRRVLSPELYARVAGSFHASRRNARLGALPLLILLAWAYGYLPRAIHQMLYHW